jgi:hypothetical protein
MHILRTLKGGLLLTMGASIYAADFTWTTGAGGNNDALWDRAPNWGGAGTPNAAGDTANILANWPTTAFGTRTIQLRQIPTTVGTLNVNTTEGNALLTLQTTQQLVFDNNGGTAAFNGAGPNQLRVNAVVQAIDTVAIDVGSMSELRIDLGITGPGGVTINGDAESTVSANGSNDGNDVLFRGGTFHYTGETRIDSGALQFHQSITSIASTSIVVNGEWDLDATTFAAPTGYFLQPTQTLSGTGRVVMTTSLNHFSRSIRSDGATIAPGDGGPGTLTFQGAGLSLTGGSFEFELSDGLSDQIVTNRLNIFAGTPGTVTIVDNGRTTTGTVTLFDYSGSNGGTGTVADLGLSLPPGWAATLVDSGTSIDLNITLIPSGTVIRFR